MFFYVDSAAELARKIGSDARAITEEPYYRHIDKTGLKLSTKLSMNVSDRYGDANRLDFPDESFDAVVSNYVYHNITGADKRALLRETLRVLKKGGVFALNDEMKPQMRESQRKFKTRLAVLTDIPTHQSDDFKAEMLACTLLAFPGRLCYTVVSID